jgi:uncharacterized protein YndB with AHSA1/START domain
MIANGTPTSLEVRRWYDAPPELVFRAMIDPSTMPRWLCPSAEIRLDVLEIDVRVGGRYRFSYVDEVGRSRSVVHGKYHTLDAPRRLAFTWTWEPPDPDAGVETLVTFDLSVQDCGTEVVLTHMHMPGEGKTRAHRAGWIACLGILELIIDNEARTS